MVDRTIDVILISKIVVFFITVYLSSLWPIICLQANQIVTFNAPGNSALMALRTMIYFVCSWIRKLRGSAGNTRLKQRGCLTTLFQISTYHSPWTASLAAHCSSGNLSLSLSLSCFHANA